MTVVVYTFPSYVGTSILNMGSLYAKNLVIASLFVGQALFAADGDVSTVIKLANTVKSVAQTSDASQDSIDQAETKLREAIELLTSDSASSGSSSNSEFVACYDFSYQKYYSSLSASSAADKASAVCKVGLDLDVAKFLFEKYYSSLSAVSAMDKAAKGSEKSSHGKLPMIKFMYEKYYSSLSAVSAADKAVAGVAKLKRNSLGCLEKLYASYYSSQSAVSAMDNAAVGCSN